MLKTIFFGVFFVCLVGRTVVVVVVVECEGVVGLETAAATIVDAISKLHSFWNTRTVLSYGW